MTLSHYILSLHFKRTTFFRNHVNVIDSPQHINGTLTRETESRACGCWAPLGGIAVAVGLDRGQQVRGVMLYLGSSVGKAHYLVRICGDRKSEGFRRATEGFHPNTPADFHFKPKHTLRGANVVDQARISTANHAILRTCIQPRRCGQILVTTSITFILY